MKVKTLSSRIVGSSPDGYNNYSFVKSDDVLKMSTTNHSFIRSDGVPKMNTSNHFFRSDGVPEVSTSPQQSTEQSTIDPPGELAPAFDPRRKGCRRVPYRKSV